MRFWRYFTVGVGVIILVLKVLGYLNGQVTAKLLL